MTTTATDGLTPIALLCACERSPIAPTGERDANHLHFSTIVLTHVMVTYPAFGTQCNPQSDVLSLLSILANILFRSILSSRQGHPASNIPHGKRISALPWSPRKNRLLIAIAPSLCVYIPPSTSQLIHLSSSPGPLVTFRDNTSNTFSRTPILPPVFLTRTSATSSPVNCNGPLP